MRVFELGNGLLFSSVFFKKGFLNSDEYLTLYEACELKRTGERCGITLCCVHVFVCKRKAPKMKIIELLSKNATLAVLRLILCFTPDEIPYRQMNASCVDIDFTFDLPFAS